MKRKMRVKPIVVEVIEDDGMWFDESTCTYYSKDQLEPVEEPKGLDEAAKEYESYYDVDDSQPYLYVIRGDTAEAFRNGAKWMVNQGVIFDYELKGRNTIENLDMEELKKNGISFGDKVTVQIRKK